MLHPNWVLLEALRIERELQLNEYRRRQKLGILDLPAAKGRLRPWVAERLFALAVRLDRRSAECLLQRLALPRA